MPVGKGADEGIGETEWIVNRDKSKYDNVFNTLEQVEGKITGRIAREELVKSKLPSKELGKIWRLADVDHDGLLDAEEFALAMHLIKVKVDGYQIPEDLPAHLIPPSHRSGAQQNGYE